MIFIIGRYLNNQIKTIELLKIVIYLLFVYFVAEIGWIFTLKSHSVPAGNSSKLLIEIPYSPQIGLTNSIWEWYSLHKTPGSFWLKEKMSVFTCDRYVQGMFYPSFSVFHALYSSAGNPLFTLPSKAIFLKVQVLYELCTCSWKERRW